MKKIAIYENTNILLLRIKKLLSSLGLDSVELSNVRYKNKIQLNHSLNDIDLILVDIDNLGSDIVSFMDSVKVLSPKKEIPIIALSEHSDIKLLKDIIRLGCVDFIMKPFDNFTFLSKFNDFFFQNTKIEHPYLADENIDLDSISLVWNDDFKLGIEAIDLEHKTLFDHFQKLYSLMHDDKGHEYFEELLDFLKNYVKTHFENEEKYQEEINYPLIASHKEAHRTLTKKLDDLIVAHVNKEITDIDLIRINLFLQDWLIHHVLIEDQKISDYVLNQNT